MYTVEELKELALSGVYVSINITLTNVIDEGTTEEVILPDPDKPETEIVQTKEGAVLYRWHPDYLGATNPVLQGTGIRPNVGTYFEVETKKVLADGGGYLYVIWRGENNDTSVRGLYLKEDSVY